MDMIDPEINIDTEAEQLANPVAHFGPQRVGD